MAVVELQLSPWEKTLIVDSGDLTLSLCDQVIIKTESGLDLAKVVDCLTTEATLDDDARLLRLATAEDLKQTMSESTKSQIFKTCHELVKQLGLNMKLVDLRSSFDNTRLVFAFVANGRVDFRELVKELTHRFNKNIRLQQIGIRDEAKVVGDQGRCGRGLCCRESLTKFCSVTSDVAEAQNLAGRGNDRLSGACGRLMCCLAYEADGYKELSKKMPAIGSELKVDGKSGCVIGHNLLKQTLSVKFKGESGESDYIIEVDWSK